MRLTRRDGDQDLTKFSATLPPGMVAKLAGVSECPDAAIANARAKTGKQELASPSCPASSQIGRVLGGAGVGSQLTYVRAWGIKADLAARFERPDGWDSASRDRVCTVRCGARLCARGSPTREILQGNRRSFNSGRCALGKNTQSFLTDSP